MWQVSWVGRWVLSPVRAENKLSLNKTIASTPWGARRQTCAKMKPPQAPQVCHELASVSHSSRQQRHCVRRASARPLAGGRRDNPTQRAFRASQGARPVRVRLGGPEALRRWSWAWLWGRTNTSRAADGTGRHGLQTQVRPAGHESPCWAQETSRASFGRTKVLKSGCGAKETDAGE